MQILSLPYKAYDAPMLEAQALHLLNRYRFGEIPQDIGLRHPPKTPIHMFGSLEGLRYTANLESPGIDEKLIAPYLLREGCEGMTIENPKINHSQLDLAEATTIS